MLHFVTLKCGKFYDFRVTKCNTITFDRIVIMHKYNNVLQRVFDTL